MTPPPTLATDTRSARPSGPRPTRPPADGSPAGRRGAPRPRVRRKDARPAEILAAALALFVERGFAGTRIEDVAARAGVSKGTVFLYFATKQALFEAVVREGVVARLRDWRAEAERSDAPSAELLRRFFTDWWRDFGEKPVAGIAKLAIAEAANFPELGRFFHAEVVRPNGELLGWILARGIARGEFRPVDVPVAVRVWMSPPVLKVVWMHSLGAFDGPDEAIDPHRFLSLHVESVLATLQPPSSSPGTPER